MLSWWGDVGSNVKTNDASVVGDVTGFSILPGSDDVYNSKTGAWDKLASGPNYAPNMAYIGWGVYVMATRRQRREEAQGGMELRGPSRRQGHLAVDGGLSVGLPALPQLALRHSRSGLRPATTRPSSAPISCSNRDSYNHPNAAIEPRIPGIFQYYSIAEDELAKIFAGQSDAQTGRRQHRRRLGEDHRPDRPRQPDQALQGLAGHVRLAATSGGARTGAAGHLDPSYRGNDRASAMNEPAVPRRTSDRSHHRPDLARPQAARADRHLRPRSALFALVVLLQILNATGVLELGFTNWRPTLYAYVAVVDRARLRPWC